MNLNKRIAGKIVRCIYLDDAGFGDEKHEPIAVVAAVLVNADTQWKPIERDIDSIIERFVPEDSREGFEFHAKELFSSSKRTRSWGQPLRHAVLEEFVKLFDKYKLPILPGAANRSEVRKMAAISVSRGRLKGQNLLDLMSLNFAFLACSSVVNLWLKMFANREVGICFADKLNTDRVEWLKANLNFFRRNSLNGDPESRWDRLVDTVYWAESHESMGLQLADSAAFFYKRHLMEKADSEHFYSIIEPYVFNPFGVTQFSRG
ncbi:MAG: DUF3800 domain-containing protein [Deltaproteobacteria bacterium]|nr:DUF3800 domain-containing protein [Deltaproteobacteria bacterium]